METNDLSVIDLLTEIRDIQRILLENDKARMAITQRQAELYSRNLEAAEEQREASERRVRISIMLSILFAVAVFFMILLLLTHR